MVTSRNQLHGLVARQGARPIHLGVLTDTEAHTLPTTTLGPNHAAANASAITQLIEWCDGFPLALGLIASRAAANPHLLLQNIVVELRTLGVDALDSEDPTASLPTVLSWSLHHLSDQQRQVFALLGIAPGPDIGLPRPPEPVHRDDVVTAVAHPCRRVRDRIEHQLRPRHHQRRLVKWGLLFERFLYRTRE